MTLGVYTLDAFSWIAVGGMELRRELRGQVVLVSLSTSFSFARSLQDFVFKGIPFLLVHQFIVVSKPAILLNERMQFGLERFTCQISSRILRIVASKTRVSKFTNEF